jgi:hypothetical protein
MSSTDRESLYERDYYGWIQHNVTAIREGRLQDVDWVNVAEELEDMGKSEKRALRSQMARLLAHLLKWAYQPKLPRTSEHSWRSTIEHAREAIDELLDESPSLKPRLAQVIAPADRDALAQVIGESNLPKKTFPATCPWTLDEIMAEYFWPDS